MVILEIRCCPYIVHRIDNMCGCRRTKIQERININNDYKTRERESPVTPLSYVVFIRFSIAYSVLSNSPSHVVFIGFSIAYRVLPNSPSSPFSY